MSQVKRVVTPNAREVDGKWYQTTYQNATLRVQAFNQAEAEKKIKVMIKDFDLETKQEETN